MKNKIVILSLSFLSIPAIAGSGAGSAVGNGFVAAGKGAAPKMQCGELNGLIGKESKKSKKLILSESCKVKKDETEIEFKAGAQIIVDEKGKVEEVKK